MEKTIEAINKKLEADEGKQYYALLQKRMNEYKHEEYKGAIVGASAVGTQCKRALWYKIRKIDSGKKLEGRIIRLFNRGHIEELRVLALLDLIGIVIESTQASKLDGILGGTCDTIARGFPEFGGSASVEIKTHKNSSFNDFKKNKVYKSNPQHYAQMQIYMDLFGQDNAVYIAVNKDNDELYFEHVTRNQDYIDYTLQILNDVINSNTPPLRIRNDKSFFICKMCEYSDICYGKRTIKNTCGSCSHCEIQNDGWNCNHHDIKIPSLKLDCVKHKGVEID